jgi:putative peptidoglycan lipid II flippase
MSDHRKLLRSASTISTITIISRIFGYIRDSRIAFLLGTGDLADAFTLAFRIPNLLRRLVGEGGVNAAVVPLFSGYVAADNRKDAFEFFNLLLTLATLLMAGVTMLGILFAPLIVRLLAGGFETTAGKLEMTAYLSRIMFPYVGLISVSALCMGILNSLHRFAAPAFAPVLLNLSVISASFIAGRFSNPAAALALGVVLGGILQILIQIRPLQAAGWRRRFAWNLAHPAVRQVGRMLLPLLFGIGILQINVLVGMQFASHMKEGSVASINLADRVMELVLGGYTLALSTAILPLLSRQAARRELAELRETLNLATRMILFITVPATIGLVVLRYQIIEVLFEHGRFDRQSTELTANPLLYFALGLSVVSIVKIIVPAFYALRDTHTPVAVAFVSMLLNIGLNFAFMRPLENGGPALATSLAAVFDSVCLLTIFHRRYGSIGIRNVCGSLLKSLAAGLAMGWIASAMIRLPGFYAGETPHRVLALGGTIVVATIVYFVATWILRARELRELWGMYGGQPAVD